MKTIRQYSSKESQGERRLLTAIELAVYLGTTRGNLYKLVSQRRVPYVKVGRSTRFDIRAIDAWIEQRSVEVRDLKG